ncbi:hypothetical protein Hdeb2414_s0006g00220721 [Helianthus debilis subsp. tardiflorus]
MIRLFGVTTSSEHVFKRIQKQSPIETRHQRGMDLGCRFCIKRNDLQFNAPLAVYTYNVYMCGLSGGKSESALILTLYLLIF